ncbi:zinc-binding alcohol dehydrogenase [Pelagicoccus enzymogenes]|uniref:zinc-dependent alcohol dehydrogenase n=1 Tax=Pelagicoccus enzymogenes TaxID=2773457 RepID=UPI00280F909F|nr:zinc-binding alcohol dehydrogenase [Pelagicoccus enzymogenes]MDQ8199426.1 zinc-binding alcohol dehydrogenase [Pelagicoccus enzymogenes]
MKTRAIAFTAPGKANITEIEIPQPGPGEVLIETAYSCISSGTELRCFAGKQEGSPPWPFIPGYSMSGRVLQSGPGVELAIGTPVFANGTRKASIAPQWGAHTAHAICNADDVIPLPDSIPLRIASTFKIAAISAHGLRLSQPSPGQRIGIVGLGPIGFVSALLHQLRGAKVAVLDSIESRRERARSYGLHAVEPAETIRGAFSEVFPTGLDTVVDCTGAAAAFGQCLSALSHPAWDNAIKSPRKLVVQGSYAGNISVNYNDAFMREVQIVFPRDNQRRDLEQVAKLCANNELDLSCLIGKSESPPSEAQEVYNALDSRTSEALGAVFRW